MHQEGKSYEWALAQGLEELRFTRHSVTKICPVELILHSALTDRNFEDPRIRQAKQNMHKRSEAVRRRTESLQLASNSDLKGRFGVEKTDNGVNLYRVDEEFGNSLEVNHNEVKKKINKIRLRCVTRRRQQAAGRVFNRRGGNLASQL